MSTVIDKHPDAATLEAFHCGKLDSEKRSEVEAHLAVLPGMLHPLCLGEIEG